MTAEPGAAADAAHSAAPLSFRVRNHH